MAPYRTPIFIAPRSAYSWILSIFLISQLLAAPHCIQAEIDFNRDVRPILSENCFACHGFDESSREADLRLDTREGATADLGGYSAIIAGSPETSELFTRITTDDDSLLMPPSESHKPRLAPEQIETLRHWIKAGAPWGKHWAFVPPSINREDAGETSEADAHVPSATHPIDRFVRRRLGEAGLSPSPRANPHTLARRLAFDLTGLPPTIQQVNAFGDGSREQLQAYIDDLISSKHFGERMAMWWLDGARYSDTDGYQQDATRTNWPWRDWVIDAFNENMPFDQFTVEQFAGDLLPNATPEQRLATCFHRNHMNNGEGGRDAEESRVDYVLDRVNTVGTLWLGLTLGCAQCHDHKFDPVSQADYYRLNAYFNSIDETGQAGGNAGPYMTVKSEYAGPNLREAQEAVEISDRQLDSITEEAKTEFRVWLDSQVQAVSSFVAWTPLTPLQVESTEGYQLQAVGNTVTSLPAPMPQDDFIFTVDRLPMDRLTAIRLDVLADAQHTDGKFSHAPSGEFILTNFKVRIRKRGSTLFREVECVRAIADVEGKGVDTKYGSVRGTLDDDPRTGWTTRTKPAKKTHSALFELSAPVRLDDDELLEIILMQRSLAPQELIGKFELHGTNQRGPAITSLGTMPLERLAAHIDKHGSGESAIQEIDAKLTEDLFQQFLEDHDSWQAVKRRNRIMHRQLSAAKKASGDVKVTILKERSEPRETHILERGVWDQKGRVVQRGVPSFVASRKDELVPTRLELAKWVVADDNPLTPRVIVNQVWQLFFGYGLVRTPNDFGQQGELPTHPELLDWLAVEFRTSGWDVKHLVKTIVTSETYLQNSATSPELLERDPENRLLARGARFRLPAWMIRDASLAASGLLNRRMGGPPVFPYQPEGVWRDQFMGRFQYEPTLGVGQYRRTIYAFWRRSSTPTFLFDSATRRSCEVTARRTNTPLHALTLMNDLTALESARSIAERVQSKSSELETQIELLFRHVLGRSPSKEEQVILLGTHQRATKLFMSDPSRAVQFATTGQLKPPETNDAQQLAPLMLVANLVFNLDEAITHE